jgi:hypothetical protein
MAGLASAEAHSLTSEEMHRLLPGVPILEYSDDASWLGRFPFGNTTDAHGRALLFFPEVQNANVLNGHWLGLVYSPPYLHVFDPYGGKGDPWLKDHTFAPKGVPGRVAIARPVLADLAARLGVQLKPSPFPFEHMSPNIQTCGRHTAVRLHFYRMSDQQYHTMMLSAMKKTGLDYDELVTRMTESGKED